MAILSFKQYSAKELSGVDVHSVQREPVKKAARTKRKFEELKGHNHEKKEMSVARPRLTIKLRPKVTIKLQSDVVRRALRRVRKLREVRSGGEDETGLNGSEDTTDPSIPLAKKLKTEESAASLGDSASTFGDAVPAEEPRRWGSTQHEIDESNKRRIALNLNDAPWTDPDMMGPNEGEPVLGPVEVQESEPEVKECKCGEVGTCEKCRVFAEELHKHFEEWNAGVGWTWA